MWRLHDAAPVCVLEGHERAVTSVAFSPDGASLLTVSEDRSARLWRIPDGQLLHILRKRNRILRGRDREPRSGVFSPADSGVVVTGAWGFRLLVWDARRGKLQRKLWGTFGPDVDVSPDGARIVAPSDARVRIWDLHSRAERWAVDLGDHREDVSSVAFAVDGTYVVSSAQHEVRITPSDGKGAPIAIPVPQGIADARLSPDGSLLLGACLDHTARVWEAWPREEAVTIGPVTLLSVSATSAEGSFVTHAPGHSYTLWDVAGRQLGVLGPDPGSVAVAAFGPGGQLVACAGPDAVVSLWHAHDASPLATWPCGQGEIQSLCFSPDGSVLLSGDADGTVTSWTVATGSTAVLAATRPGPVRSLRWSPRGDRVVAVHRDRSDSSRGALLDAGGRGGDRRPRRACGLERQPRLRPRWRAVRHRGGGWQAAHVRLRDRHARLDGRSRGAAHGPRLLPGRDHGGHHHQVRLGRLPVGPHHRRPGAAAATPRVGLPGLLLVGQRRPAAPWEQGRVRVGPPGGGAGQRAPRPHQRGAHGQVRRVRPPHRDSGVGRHGPHLGQPDAG